MNPTRHRNRSSVSECLTEFFYHPDWSEVVRLVAAQLHSGAGRIGLSGGFWTIPDPAGTVSCDVVRVPAL